jgi:hypothetical protein
MNVDDIITTSLSVLLGMLNAILPTSVTRGLSFLPLASLSVWSILGVF